MTDAIDPRLRIAIESRLRDHEGCWLWTAAVDAYGMPVLHHRGRWFIPQRVLWQIWRPGEPLPPQITRICRQQRCVNPHHFVEKKCRSSTSG